MGIGTLYNLDIASPTQITDEEYNNVGANEFFLGDIKRGFYDVVIRTAAAGGGTLLTQGSDYTRESADSHYGEKAGFAIYTGIKVITAGYQTGNLYMTYKCIGSYTSIDTFTSILPIGTVFPWPVSTAPTGFFICNHDLKSKANYDELYDVLKDGGAACIYGESGTDFYLPDYRGAGLRGTGSHGSATMADGNPYAGPAIATSENDQAQAWQAGANADLAGSREYWGIASTRDYVSTNDSNTVGYTKLNAKTGGQGSTAGLIAKNDGTHGDPRQGDETRGFAFGVNYIIKY